MVIDSMILLLAVSGVIGYYVTDTVKSTVRLYLATTKRTANGPWWNLVFRVTPIVVGTLAGHFLSNEPLTLLIGACGGALSSAVYAVVKAKLKSVIGSRNDSSD